MTKFVMMIGVPGSGKSTYAHKELTTKYNAEVFSSDDYRNKYANGEQGPAASQITFGLMHKDVLAAIKAGKNVIYDATNLTYKSRRGILSNLPKDVIKIAIVMLKPFEVCMKYNKEREAVVPDDKMVQMYKRFQPPCFEEGFNEIHLIGERNMTVDDLLQPCENFNQQNHHHTLTLDKHMEKASWILEHTLDADSALSIATRIHDIGKPFCQVFVDGHGNPTEEAHYFNHENVGAYLALFLNEDVKEVLKIAWLIAHHMDPFSMTTDVSIYRFIDKWGKDNYDNLRKLHICDTAAK